GDVIGVATQKEPSTTNPGEADLYRSGTFARVIDLARLPSGDYRVALEATVRFHLDKLVQSDPYWVAEGRPAVETGGDAREAQLFARALGEQVAELAKGGGSLGQIGDPDED